MRTHTLDFYIVGMCSVLTGLTSQLQRIGLEGQVLAYQLNYENLMHPLVYW